MPPNDHNDHVLFKDEEMKMDDGTPYTSVVQGTDTNNSKVSQPKELSRCSDGCIGICALIHVSLL